MALLLVECVTFITPTKYMEVPSPIHFKAVRYRGGVILSGGATVMVAVGLTVRLVARRQDTGQRIARELQLNYAFVCEFEELYSSARDDRSQVHPALTHPTTHRAQPSHHGRLLTVGAGLRGRAAACMATPSSPSTTCPRWRPSGTGGRPHHHTLVYPIPLPAHQPSHARMPPSERGWRRG